MKRATLVRTGTVTLSLLAASMACNDKTPTTPVVVATPTPTPTPTPVPLGQGLACGLPKMPECGQTVGDPAGMPPGVYGCCTKEPREVGQFRSMVSDAINKLQGE